MKNLSRVLLLVPALVVLCASANAAPPKKETVKLETATFAAGCFWGTEEYFRNIPGVVETKVGYTGGTKKADYEEVGSGTTGHAESLELKFDPKKISYQELVTKFFKMHDPTTLNRQGNDVGSQYRSAIFTHSDEQMKTAKLVEAKVEKSGAWKKPVTTEITKAGPFYDAEDYHQKFLEHHPKGDPQYYDNHYVRDLNFDEVKK